MENKQTDPNNDPNREEIKIDPSKVDPTPTPEDIDPILEFANFIGGKLNG